MRYLWGVWIAWWELVWEFFMCDPEDPPDLP